MYSIPPLNIKYPLRMKSIFKIGIPLVLLMGTFIFFGVLPRVKNQQELRAGANEEAKRVPLVKVVTVQAVGDTNGLTLPGQIMPFRETNIFARTQGFLKRRLVDIGSQVRRGQLLATVEAPEFDQEILRAQADLQLAQTNLDRVKSVTLPGAVAQQDVDNRQASVTVNRATVSRLQALKALQQVHAPFNGVITTRNAEIGNLVQAGAGLPMFTLAQLDTLRVYVDVPQTYFQAIKIGLPATVTIPEMKGRKFMGKVVRTSGTLRTQSRTLLTEIAIPNRDGTLMAGLYGQVKLGVKAVNPPVMIPANTLMITPEGTKVALVTPNGLLHYQAITLGRDFGNSLEVIDGLTGGEQLVTNPTDRLEDGKPVRVKK
jgi:membrane fusion protein, multidrug efflux system